MPPATGLVVAFDFGARRIGIATGNLTTRTASPLTTLRTHGGIPWRDIDEIMAEWKPMSLVVGRPEGEGATQVAKSVEQFATALAARYALPVSTVDETLTSVAAHAELAAGRRSGYLRRRIGRGHVDRVAACLIAEQWMSEQSVSPGGS